MDVFIRNQSYTGPVRGVILDWAGTAVDYGSIGPVAVFMEIFAKFGVEVTVSQARQFMGQAKKDHIRCMCRLEDIEAKWIAAHGAKPTEKDVDAMYEQTEPMMIEAIKKNALVIPGLLEAIQALRAKGIRVGSSTGYTAPMMATLAPLAKDQGYVPDAMVCSSDVPAGRPYPWMCFLNAIRMEVYPMESIVKIGDTLADVQEGLNAGMWTIGLTRSGNELGLTQAETEAMDPGELESRLREIEARYVQAGVHYVAEGVWDVPRVIATIEDRLSRGERP